MWNMTMTQYRQIVTTLNDIAFRSKYYRHQKHLFKSIRYVL